MEEEEIIIDGVNVAECCCYNKDDEPYCCELYTIQCEEQDCYFKQLQRLKQENEKYKQFIQWLSTQQYYILPKNIKEKIKEVLNEK